MLRRQSGSGFRFAGSATPPTVREEGATTVPYYIPGEKKHILIHLTVFDEDETEVAKEAAMYIANGFVWPE
jgi:hypothetical protein